MRFADPIWLAAGAVIVAALLLLLVRAEVLRARALALLSAARVWRTPAGLPCPLRRWLRVALATFAVAMGFVALARPQKGTRWETVERKGLDLLLVVDTSKSMDADDVKPTRLERVKLSIQDLVERFPGDRIGVVAFAGDAFVESPMTLDHAALLETVDALDTSIVARGGTNIGRAIDVATAALATEPDHHKEMVLLTDGEDLAGGALEAAKRAAAQGITIHAVGVGSSAGEFIPARDERGRPVDIVRDEHGQAVRSRLDESGLQAIAATSHGAYRRFGFDGDGLDHLYKDTLAGQALRATSSRSHRVYVEWFQFPLALGLLSLLFDSLLGVAWRSFSRTRRARLPAIAAAAAGLSLLFVQTPAHASVRDAEKAYAAKDFAKAMIEYQAASAKQPLDARLAFNAGDAAYKAQHYATAHEAFERALRTSDPTLRQRVLYNQGDALYRLGQTQRAQDRTQTVESWKAAIAAYEKALALNAKDADARFNRDFVKQKLAELEKEKPKPSEPSAQRDQKKSGQAAKPGASGRGRDDKGASGKPASDGSGNASANGHAPTGNEKRSASEATRAQSNPAKGTVAQPQRGTNAGQLNAERPANGAASQPGQLSQHDARALLDALRGEERHGATIETAEGAPTDDEPGKDW